MNTISKLPEKKGVIGPREIVKAINAGKVRHVIAASNCPSFIMEKVPKGVKIEMFEGDQKQLGTKLGKPFTVAIVGYAE